MDEFMVDEMARIIADREALRARVAELELECDKWRKSATYRGEIMDVARAIGSQALLGGPFVVR